MHELSETFALERIAAALERLSPPQGRQEWAAAPAFVWDGCSHAVATLDAPTLDQLRGIDAQKARVTENLLRHAAGLPAHDMLLWGARGMGKSALLRAGVMLVQAQRPGSLALVQIAAAALDQIPRLFESLADEQRRFVVFIDDLGFAEGDSTGPRAMRSWLEGGVAARPDNVRLAVTTNRRAIVPRHGHEQDDPINPRDAVDDQLALADRFGLSLGFHACSQADYLAIIAGYAEPLSLAYTESQAIAWAAQRGARSGRVAWQFVVECAGQAGVAMEFTARRR